MDHLLDVQSPQDRREHARAARRAARLQARAEHPSAGPHHDHGHRGLLQTGWGRGLIVACAVLAVLTIVGLAVLWPGGTRSAGASQAFGGKTTPATVLAVQSTRCPGPTAQRCRRLIVSVAGGPGTPISLGPEKLTSDFGRGDHIRVQPTGAPAGTPGAEAYAFAGAERRSTLLWLAAVFAALVVLLARWRGLLALAGFALSLLLVVKFLVPALLAGSPPVLVGLTGALAVMFVTVGLTYGITPQSAAAALGIAASLALAAGLGTLAVHDARLDGRSSDLSTVLSQTNSKISLQGVVLAGLVLGALGVLADMGVTQASAVMAIRRANPSLGPRRLFREAFAVGRDHLVATTHTLVLVYVGATLPLLLVLQSARVATADALNAQDLAEPIVATLVGAIALLISVPLTTALSALVVARIPPDALPDSIHVHAH